MSVQPPGPTEFGVKLAEVDGDSRYSRFVTWMKIVLPVGAAILLVTVFVSSGTFNVRDRLAITFQEIGPQNDDLRMVSPRISGVDRRGRPYVVTADTATQTVDNPNRIAMENIEADMMLDDGGNWISLTARSGILLSEAEHLTLEENIDVFAASGYEFHAETAEIDMKQGTLVSRSPVRGQGPIGTLEANGMEASDKGETIRFTGGVRVVTYQ